MMTVRKVEEMMVMLTRKKKELNGKDLLLCQHLPVN